MSFGTWWARWRYLILLLLVLTLATWQTCTWLWLRNDLRGWMLQHSPDGTTPPPPPPAF